MKYLGIFITLLYLGFVGWLLGDKILELDNMALNEIGDFCAGVFGPITFFWMILGFIMQTQELKQSSDSLKLQAQELSNSVEQQKEMVLLTKQQVERELEQSAMLRKKQVEAAQLTIDYLGNNGFTNADGYLEYRFQLRNSGCSVTEVELTVLYGEEYILSPSELLAWDKNKIVGFSLKFINTGHFPHHISFYLEYTDGQRNKNKKKFALIINDCGSNALSFKELTS